MTTKRQTSQCTDFKKISLYPRTTKIKQPLIDQEFVFTTVQTYVLLSLEKRKKKKTLKYYLSKLSQSSSQVILKIMQPAPLDKTKADIQIEKEKLPQKHVVAHHEEINKMNASFS